MAIVALEAELAHIGFGSLLQLAEAELVTGRIEVGDAGSIRLAAGQVVGAETRAIASDYDAVLALFLVSAGRAKLVLDADVRGVVVAPTFTLVMEGCRVADEWREIGSQRLKLHGLPESSDPRTKASHKALASVLHAHGSEPDLRASVAASGLPPLAALEHARHLLDAGLASFDVNPAPSNPNVPNTPTDADALFEEGRAAFRESRLDDAARLFALALEARPNDRVLAQNLRVVRQRLAHAEAR